MAFLWPSTGFRSLRGTGDGHLPEGVPEEPAAVGKKKKQTCIIQYIYIYISYILYIYIIYYIYGHFWSLIYDMMGYDGI